ncbi:MAG TPA: GGDEF domain-containing protein [Burkholderiaceae bacterium]|nr:GGDEF domain-containing protein [Burkholderiaceae bacterium]
METRPTPLGGSTTDATQLAKAALRRLVLEKLEPTPENYARAYRLEAGDAASLSVLPDRAVKLIERLALRALDIDPAAGATAAADLARQMGLGRWEQAERVLQEHPAVDPAAYANLLERIVRGVERGSRAWTTARKKDSLQRVIAGSRSDSRRLQQRLTQLVASWDSDTTEASGESMFDSATGRPAEQAATRPAPLDTPPTEPAVLDGSGVDLVPWRRVSASFSDTIACALAEQDGAAQDLLRELETLNSQMQAAGADSPLAASAETFGQRAQQVIAHRHHLFKQLGALCEELTASLAELAEDDSWVQGQCQAMRTKIEEGLTGRGVRAVGDLLRDTRERQGRLREERERARDSLKGLINRMLSELDELGSQTGNFHDSVGRYADVIEKADSLESLAGVVREMVEESRSVQSLVQQTQARLKDEHDKARELTQRVGELEDEMRRLSDEVSTDQLTQIANRRGLLQAFEAERSRLERGGGSLSVGLLDIDNFKRLNDELGHSAGDEALKSLAALVSSTLRPTDRVARYGGEEFVVLLPETPVDEGQQILTRLQRSLTGGLFMHESKQVFVTFSAGVTAYRESEAIETALERADQALYEAKRTGKNRTCIG